MKCHNVYCFFPMLKIITKGYDQGIITFEHGKMLNIKKTICIYKIWQQERRTETIAA